MEEQGQSPADSGSAAGSAQQDRGADRTGGANR